MAIDWNLKVGKKINNGPGELEILELFTTLNFKLTTIYWFKVRCFCGNIFKTRCGDLFKSGNRGQSSKSCGCWRIQTNKMKALTKEEILIRLPKDCKLTPIKSTDNRVTSEIIWEWQCSCGNIYYANNQNVLNGSIKSCGCKRKENASLLSNKFFKKSVDSYNEQLKLLGSIHKVIEIDTKTTISTDGKNTILYWDTIQCGTCKRIYQTQVSGLLSQLKNKSSRMQGRVCNVCSPLGKRFENTLTHITNKYRKHLGIWPQCNIRTTRGILRSKKRYRPCEYCGVKSWTQTHHIIPRHKIVNRFYHLVKDTFHLENEIINHPRNLIHICKNCHDNVHLLGFDTVDATMTKIFKAIKRYSW